MAEEHHDPLQCVTQLRQTLAAGKLSVGFLIGAGCPSAINIAEDKSASYIPLIPNIKRLTELVVEGVSALEDFKKAYSGLVKTFTEDGENSPTIESILNRIRRFREVAGKAAVRGLTFQQLDKLDQKICQLIRDVVTRDLPPEPTPYHALASFVGKHRTPFTEVFTTNYDLLIEQALECKQVPYFDGFIGSARPFFDQRAIEDGEIPKRWSRLWKLHGSINWHYDRSRKCVVRSERCETGDELLIHPSHLKYDESRRMPYFVMIDRLRNFLRNAEQPVALIIAGYSFGDDHINEAIIESLKANASAACFALQYGNLSSYKSAVDLAKGNSNLSILAEDRAVIRRREGSWLANPMTDMAALRGAFELISSGAATGGQGEPSDDAPKSCKFRLGNFLFFGEFLDNISDSQVLGGSGD